MRLVSALVSLVILVPVVGCATIGRPTTTAATSRTSSRLSRSEVGTASFYAHRHHGRGTAAGGVYDESALTAAHPTLPFGTRVRVTNLRNDRKLVLTITDRGPFVHGRIIDVSRRAASELGFLRQGTARVRVEVLRS